MGKRSRLRAARKAARPALLAQVETAARDELATRKPDVIHRRHYADGMETPMETHIRLAVNQRCNGCERRPGEILILVYLLVADMPEQARALVVAKHRGNLPIVQLKAGPAVLASRMAACSQCRRSMLTAAAKGPSYAFVDIVEAPQAVVRAAHSVQVPGMEHSGLVIAHG